MRRRSFPIVYALSFLAALSLDGCRRKAPSPEAVPTPAPTPGPPAIDYDKVRPNELGRIPVIMYHEIGAPIGRDTDLNRTVASFRQDLELLHKNGFVPVNMSDVVKNRIDVPAGKSPVVLTFDDARESQFRLIETKDAFQVDPNCALGVLEAFVKSHPDWPLRATFYVLPKSKVTVESFRQVGLGAQKLKYLIEKGMELGNHTTLHHSLGPMTAAQIQQELGNAQKVIGEQVGGVAMETMALPMGIYPRDKKVWPALLSGTYGGTAYAHRAVLLAAWRPIPSPAARDFDPSRLERISPRDVTNGLRDWITKLTRGAPYERYVSDGDPDTISYPSSERVAADEGRLREQGKRIHAYEAAGGGSKPIVSSQK